jgi:hypothetical protein
MPDDEVRTVPVYVHNVFLIKHVMDDKEHKSDGLYLVGTFVQNAFRGNSNASVLIKDDIPGPIRFAYRFNDETADERNGAIELRRSQIHETRDLGKMDRHTFQVKAPLEIDVEFDAFPFKVVSANLTIELSSFTTRDKKTIIRPNLMVHRHEKRIMFGIQKDFTRRGTNPSKKLPFFLSKEGALIPFFLSKESALIRQAKDKIDKSYVYDFVSPFPNVTYLYDTQKKYCPKYLVTFLLVEDGMKKFIVVVFPMILIAALNHLNVINAKIAAENPDTSDDVNAVDYLNNSATFALAVVVFLPTMIGSSQFHSVFTANNLYIMTIFAALALSALPVEIVDSTTPAQIGSFLFWTSFSFPVVNGFRFLKFIRMHQSSKAEYFMEDAITKKLSSPSKFKPSVENNVLDEFIPVGELVELDESQLAAMEYKKGERGNKFKIVEFASKFEGVVLVQ